MTTLNSYPMTITPLSNVTRRSGKGGSKYISFRADVESAGKISQRTIRAFGPRVDEALPKLRKGVPIEGRFSYDSFTGVDGNHSQTLRIVSLAA